jgi:hypothetical protein
MLGAGVEEGARRGAVRERERGEKIEEGAGLLNHSRYAEHFSIA